MMVSECYPGQFVRFGAQSISRAFLPIGKLALIVAVDNSKTKFRTWTHSGDIIVLIQGKLEFYAAYWFEPLT